MHLIVTIPAYNEERTISKVLAEIRGVLEKMPYTFSLLVVDDGSVDNTASVAKKAGAVVVRKNHSGLADTFRREMKECLALGADVIVHTDADGQYHPRHIPELLRKIEEGYHLVLGSRFRGSIEQMPMLKRVGNIIFSRVISSLTRTKITDSTTGFRAFTRAIASDINYINTFTYTQEQIIRAAKQGFRITEIPVTARKTRKSRLFRNPLEYALRAWVNILRIYRDYEPLAFFGRIGVAIFLTGFLLGVWLFYRFVTLGFIGRTPSLMLSVLLLVVGIQVILFGFLADMIHKQF